MSGEHYVAFLDILGFKERVSNSEINEILAVFNSIIRDDTICIPLSRAADIDYNNTLSKLRINIMSDSIVVSVPSDMKYALETIINTCMVIQVGLYECNKPALLRGAIAKGEFFCKDSIVFGKAMVDAYLYQEKISIYPRIIMSKNIESELANKEKVIPNLRIDRRDNYYYIDCLEQYIGDDKQQSNGDKIRKMIDNYLNDYTDIRVREKYMWLQEEYFRIVGDRSKKS